VHLKEYKLFKGLAIIVYAQNISLALLNTLESLEEIYTTMSSLTSMDVIASCMLCLRSSNVWELF
jgi:hypothetical protein